MIDKLISNNDKVMSRNVNLISKNDKMMWIYDLFFYLATIWFRKTSRWCEKGIIILILFILKKILVKIKKNKRTIVKRIIGKPGDIIKIDKFVYVNGQQFDEIETDDEENKHKEIILKNNQYFVLGDNRANSIDSRNKEIGIIQYKEILGKVIEKNGM